MRGLFITLEGGDGAGKSTQIKFMKSFFEERNFVVVCTREPGGTNISEKLRNILLDKTNSEMEAVTEMMIYAAARSQSVREFIEPALNRGEVIICDRFVDSSIAYQGYGRNLGDMVANVNLYATGGLKPDITFWLDIDPKEGCARAAKAGEPDRLEREALDFHCRVREGYKKISQTEPDRVKRIDAAGSIEDIRKEIESYLEQLIAKRD